MAHRVTCCGMDIGTVGTWFFFEGMTAAESVDFAKKLEKFGYHTHWIPEALGREPFAHSGYLLANTERLIMATGIANIWARDPTTMPAATNTLAEPSGGRGVLGIGVRAIPLVGDVVCPSYDRTSS